MHVKFYRLDAWHWNGTTILQNSWLPGIFKRLHERISALLPSYLIGSATRLRLTYRCLCLDQVSTPCMSCAECQWQSLGPLLFKKERGIWVLSILRLHVLYKVERVMNLKRNFTTHLVSSHQGIIFFLFSNGFPQLKTICGFQVPWVFLILLIRKIRNTDQMLFACLIKYIHTKCIMGWNYHEISPINVVNIK